MVATNDDILAELKKIKRLLKGQYSNNDVAEEQINKSD